MKYLLIFILSAVSLGCSAQKISSTKVNERITDLKQKYCTDRDNTTDVNSICYWKRIYASVPDSIYVKVAVHELVDERKKSRKDSWNIDPYQSAVQDYYNAQISIHQ